MFGGNGERRRRERERAPAVVRAVPGDERRGEPSVWRRRVELELRRERLRFAATVRQAARSGQREDPQGTAQVRAGAVHVGPASLAGLGRRPLPAFDADAHQKVGF